MQKEKFSKKALIFIMAVAIFTSIIFAVGGVLKNFIMLAPGLAAIFTTLITDRKWKSFGWKFPIKYALLAWLIPILYATVAYTFIWLLGLGDVPNPLFIERAKLTIGLESDSIPVIISVSFLYISLFMLIPAAVFALGEELGWRGLLFPELNKSFSFIKAAVISSLIWGAWHLPGIIFDNYGEASTPFAFRFTMFLFLIIFTGTIISWIRIKSKSIWAVAIFHASHNVVIQMFFDRITLDKVYTSYFKGEFGLALVITSFIIMFVLLKKDKSFLDSSKKLNFDSIDNKSKP